MSQFDTLQQMALASFSAVQPAEDMSVTEAGEKYNIIRQPGSHSGPWSREKTPYIVEPQDTLDSLEHQGMIFVGPARTGKSVMFLNWLAKTVKIDPVDMLLVHTTQSTGRDWSQGDLAKMLRASSAIKAAMVPGRQADNVFDKKFLSGMRLLIKWPTVSELRGKTSQRNWSMDYDGVKSSDDVEGEGNLYDLLAKRAETFKRFAMTVAESSPGREVTNPKWLAKTPHEAPPTTGILELYNRGDRRRWYWPCIHCDEAFEPDFSLLDIPPDGENIERAEGVTMHCPHCGGVIEQRYKEELNDAAKWVKDGLIWKPGEGRVYERRGMKEARSNIASFWLKGPAAYWQSWTSLALNYLNAMAAYEATGDEGPLKKTTNADQGLPYIPKARASERLPEDLRDKAEDWGATESDPTVPENVRFLVATVDVQARSFVVQVQGFAPGADGAPGADMVMIDGFKIRKSSRLDEDGDPLPMEPGAYAEDWDSVTEQVVRKTYALADGSGRRMMIKETGVDSGGREGVTFNAYAYWRRLKQSGEGLHRRVALVKGNPSKTKPRAYVTWPDSSQRGVKAAARGDVPVVMLNSNPLKDQVAAMLTRRIARREDESGGGSIRYPTWFPDWFYTQMTTEIRLAAGWDNPGNRRNESWDLAYYALGLAIRPEDATCPIASIRLERINWDDPPGWAREWDNNDLVSQPERPARFSTSKLAKGSLRDLGRKLT